MHELRINQRLQLIGSRRGGRIRPPIRSSAAPADMKSATQYVICVGNKGYAASLELRKIYQVLPDKAGSKHRQIRVIDESGEDYLYPEEYFVPVRLSQTVERAVIYGEADSICGSIPETTPTYGLTATPMLAGLKLRGCPARPYEAEHLLWREVNMSVRNP